jgi:type IV pilus assembly protein PilE
LIKLRRVLAAGFTLLEILLVLVILATLAGLAYPSYVSSVERMRTMEAVEHLMAARQSLNRYHMENGTYVGATMPSIIPQNSTLDFNPNSDMTGNNPLFRYDFAAGPTQNTYTIRATRLFTGCGVPPSGTIRMDQTGNITQTGIYG